MVVQYSKIGIPLRAFTLIEILIAGALTLMVIGISFSLLIPTVRGSARGTFRSEMQQTLAFG
jgi:type II secretory pathway pseudopilin PulG